MRRSLVVLLVLVAAVAVATAGIRTGIVGTRALVARYGELRGATGLDPLDPVQPLERVELIGVNGPALRQGGPATTRLRFTYAGGSAREYDVSVSHGDGFGRWR